MGVGNDLVEPNLMGKKLDGEKISKLFSQKTVWLLPKEDLSEDCDQPLSISDEFPTTSSEYTTETAQSPLIAPALSSTTSDQYPTSSSQYPATSSQYPTTSSQYPATSRQYPATGSRYPVTSSQYQTINQYCAKSDEDPMTTAPVPGSSNTQLSEERKIQLREMFPNKELTAIECAIANSSDLEGAISELLGEADEHGNCTGASCLYAVQPKRWINPEYQASPCIY